MNLLRSLRAIIAVLIGEVADISRRVALMPPPPYSPWFSQEENDFHMYRDALVRLFIYVALFPIPILVLGVIGGLGWVIATAALLWVIPTIALLAVATPLGILWNLFSKREESDPKGPRYVRFALSVLYLELAFALLLIVVPVGNRLSAFPIILLCITLIGLGRYLKGWFMKGAVYSIAGLVATALVFSLYFPETYDVLRWWGGTWDGKSSEKIGQAVGYPSHNTPTLSDSQVGGMNSAPRMHVSQVAGVSENDVQSPNIAPAAAMAETTFTGKAGDVFESTFTISKKNGESVRFESETHPTILWEREDGGVDSIKCGEGVGVWDPNGFSSKDPQTFHVAFRRDGKVRVMKQ